MLSVCESSVASAPFTKTTLGREWTRQKTLEMQQPHHSKATHDISLWTADTKAIEASKSPNKKDAKSLSPKELQKTDVKKSSNVKSQAEDDDDIVITEEHVNTVVPLNSLERNPKFSALHKFSDGWMQNVKSRRLELEARLERPMRESEETLRLGFSRRMKSPSVEDVINRRFQLLDMRHPAARVEVEEEDVLVELSPQMEQIISNALRKHPPGEVLTEKFNIQITRKDIATLDGLNWLNDEVVNFYMNLLMERGKNDNYQSVYAFNTFFYPKLLKMGFSGVKRWTKKVSSLCSTCTWK